MHGWLYDAARSWSHHSIGRITTAAAFCVLHGTFCTERAALMAIQCEKLSGSTASRVCLGGGLVWVPAGGGAFLTCELEYTHTHARPPPPAVEAVQADTTHHSHRAGGCWLHLCTQHPMPLAPSFHRVTLPLSQSTAALAKQRASSLVSHAESRFTVAKPKKT